MNRARRCASCGAALGPRDPGVDLCPPCLAASLLAESPRPTGRPAEIDALSPPPAPPTLPAEASRAPSSARFGKYVRTRKLAAGGMGEVWKAWDTALGRWVALKFMKEDDPELAARFAREAQTAARLSHPHIAAVYDVGEDHGKPYLAMQFVEGTTLETLPRDDRRLLVRLLRDAALAVAHAHAHGIIHRDLKPANLMVAPPAGATPPHGHRVFVTDFGLARPVRGGPRLTTRGGPGVGTPAYMAPEQARGQRTDARTDVYSLGATLYELLTDEVPFPGGTVYEILKKVEDEPPRPPRSLDRTIDRDLETIALKCLEKEPGRRYASAKALADDLDRWLDGEPVLARPVSTAYRLRKYLRKRWRSALAFAAGLVAILAVLGVSLLRDRRQEAWVQAYQRGVDEWEKVLRCVLGQTHRAQALERARRARDQFEEANRIQEKAEAHLMRARCLQFEGRREEAEGAWTRAVELDPHCGEARFHLAKSALLAYRESRQSQLSRAGATLEIVDPGPETGKQAGLRRRAEELLARHPPSGARNDLLEGILALGKGDSRAAAAALSKYSHLEPWDDAALGLEGDAWFHAGEMDRAQRAFDAALRISLSPAWINFLGLIHASRGDADAAVREYTRALELEPRFAAAHVNRGSTLYRKRELAGANADYTKALEQDPREPRTLLARAVVRLDLGDLKGALEDAAGAVRAAPEWFWTYVTRGRVLAAMRDFGGAMADYQKAIDLNPRHPSAYVSRGNIRRDQGKVDEAIADYDLALRLDPRHPLAYFNRGVARSGKGDLGGAMEDYSRAITEEPTYVKALVNRAILKARGGDPDGAIADLTRAIEIDPRFAPAYLNRGIARMEKGESQKGLADLDRSIELDPGNSFAFANRGKARGETGNLEGAVVDLEKAVQLAPPGAPYRRGFEEELQRVRQQMPASKPGKDKPPHEF